MIGSSISKKFEMRDGKPVLLRLAEPNFNNDKAGKPVAITQHIGRRPIAAFGNSRGDREMLAYTQGGTGPRFMLLVRRDDAAREYAYGPAQGSADPSPFRRPARPFTSTASSARQREDSKARQTGAANVRLPK